MGAAHSRRLTLSTGLSYHYLEWEADSPAAAHVVILLHGFLDFAWTWEDVVSSGLGGRYRILAPDLRGHGDSDRIGPGGYYHFLDYLADLQSFIEQTLATTPGARLSLVGHSMGGSVAAYYAGAFPEQLHRLAVLEGLGPPEQPLDTVPTRIRTWLAAWRRSQTHEPRPMNNLAEAAARLRRHDPRLPAELAERLAAHGTRLLPDGKLQFKHDPLHLTPGPLPFTLAIASAFWQRITCPVLLVDAEATDFRYTDEELAKRTAYFAHGQPRTATLADAGHMMQRHQPAALAALLTDFLGD
jgi:pimeloyl-ACP methyl ester carboxylesterase